MGNLTVWSSSAGGGWTPSAASLRECVDDSTTPGGDDGDGTYIQANVSHAPTSGNAVIYQGLLSTGGPPSAGYYYSGFLAWVTFKLSNAADSISGVTWSDSTYPPWTSQAAGATWGPYSGAGVGTGTYVGLNGGAGPGWDYPRQPTSVYIALGASITTQVRVTQVYFAPVESLIPKTGLRMMVMGGVGERARRYRDGWERTFGRRKWDDRPSGLSAPRRPSIILPSLTPEPATALVGA